MKIRKKNINFRFKKSKLKSKNEKSIMQRSLFASITVQRNKSFIESLEKETYTNEVNSSEKLLYSPSHYLKKE